MNSICLPIPLVLLLRRLFNAFSAFSISQTYLASRWTASLEAPDVPHDTEKALSAFPGTENLQATSWALLKGFRRPLSPRDLHLNPLLEKHADAFAASRLLHSEARAAEPPESDPESLIQRLISNPHLFDPVRAPRHPIVLCHGLYGFDVRGPETFPKLQMHYWSNVLHVLRKKVGAEVVVTGVPGTGSVASRAERMDRFLRERVKGREINFLAHSMGGLDCRHLITHIQPNDYTPLSLTSLSVPHRGSPFMDWCLANIGIGSPRPFPFPSSSTGSPRPSSASPEASSSSRPTLNPLPYSLRSPLFSRPPQTPESVGSPSFTLSMLPSSFTALVLSLIDSPAYANLTTSFLRDRFNPSTPDKPGIKYFSVAARTTKMSVWHPLWLPKLIIDAAEEQEAYAVQNDVAASQRYPDASDVAVSYPDMDLGRDRDPERGNDGLVTVSSAKWGEFLGTMEGCDHWEMRGARGLGADWDEGWGKTWREWVGSWREGEDEDRGGALSGVGALLRKARERVPGYSGRPAAEEDGKPKDWATRNDLASRFDLERFYVALSRKLYDEGL